jgi:hypothetical protein
LSFSGNRKFVLVGVLLFVVATGGFLWHLLASAMDFGFKLSVVRSAGNPMITPASSPGIGDNINGPSVIKVPNWIENPLGKFYMYFGHHKGKYIRLAYADSPHGPWKIYEPGTLHLNQTKRFRHHIASPDVIVDHENQKIWMYFHGIVSGRKQATGVASSNDGIEFESSGKVLGQFYFRVWKWKSSWYALAKDGNSGWGILYKSNSPTGKFSEQSRRFLERMRHAAVISRDEKLFVFYSRKGDAPEAILVVCLDMDRNWRLWRHSREQLVITPEYAYEGAHFPVEPSEYGKATMVHQLRDPYVFEYDGHWYLYYSIAGESGIAMAEVVVSPM